MKEQIIRKLTSRKFLTGLSLVVSGLLLIFGFADSTAETIAGAVMTICGAVGYMLAEAKVDANSAGALFDAVEAVIGALVPDDDEPDTENPEKDGEI